MSPKDTLKWLYTELSMAASRPINEDSLVLKARTWTDRVSSILKGLKDQPEWKNKDLMALNEHVSKFYGRVKAKYDRFPQDASSRDLLLAEWHETITSTMDETRKIIIQRGYA
jgi:hypothetical protein